MDRRLQVALTVISYCDGKLILRGIIGNTLLACVLLDHGVGVGTLMQEAKFTNFTGRGFTAGSILTVGAFKQDSAIGTLNLEGELTLPKVLAGKRLSDVNRNLSTIRGITVGELEQFAKSLIGGGCQSTLTIILDGDSKVLRTISIVGNTRHRAGFPNLIAEVLLLRTAKNTLLVGDLTKVNCTASLVGDIRLHRQRSTISCRADDKVELACYGSKIHSITIRGQMLLTGNLDDSIIRRVTIDKGNRLLDSTHVLGYRHSTVTIISDYHFNCLDSGLRRNATAKVRCILLNSVVVHVASSSLIGSTRGGIGIHLSCGLGHIWELKIDALPISTGTNCGLRDLAVLGVLEEELELAGLHIATSQCFSSVNTPSGLSGVHIGKHRSSGLIIASGLVFDCH